MHLDGADGPEGGESSGSFALCVLRAFELPAYGSQLAEIGVMLSSMIAFVAGGKSFVPSSAPVIVEVRLDGVRLRDNARVVPKEVAAGGLPDQIVNLGADAGQHGHLKGVILKQHGAQPVHVRVDVDVGAHFPPAP